MPTNENILNDNVVEIIDHHTVVDEKALSRKAIRTIEMVSSASTLVALNIMKHESSFNAADLFALLLLFAPIILDSGNLLSGITQPNDKTAAEYIRKKWNIDSTFQNNLFNTLLIERDDVSKLNAYELLFKDLKYVTDEEKTIKVAIPFFPMRVRVSSHGVKQCME